MLDMLLTVRCLCLLTPCTHQVIQRRPGPGPPPLSHQCAPQRPPAGRHSTPARQRHPAPSTCQRHIPTGASWRGTRVPGGRARAAPAWQGGAAGGSSSTGGQGQPGTLGDTYCACLSSKLLRQRPAAAAAAKTLNSRNVQCTLPSCRTAPAHPHVCYMPLAALYKEKCLMCFA